jgi:type IV pilus assembly protein PilE
MSTAVASSPIRTRAAPPVSEGFTLIEVMIVVAIIALLATIAVPSYREYVLRSQLVDASNLLTTGSANMERYFGDNRTYAAAGTNNPPCSAAIAVAQRTQGSFVLSCVSDATSYTLTAAGSGTTAAFSYTLDQLGNRSTTITGGPSGWHNGATCWILKKGQTCS